MNVQFAVDKTVKDKHHEHTVSQMTDLASGQASQRIATDVNQAEYEVDPDLPGDVEIDLPRERHASARTRTTMSGKSGKSKKSDTTEGRANVIRSRGRPMKPHEIEPFLSIDLLPADKTFVAEKTSNSGFTPGPPTYRSGGHDKPPLLPMHYTNPYDLDSPRPPSPSVVSDKKSPLPGSAPLSVSRPTSGRSLEFHFVPHIDTPHGSRPGTASKPTSGSRPYSGPASARVKSGSRVRVNSRAGSGSRPGSQAKGRTNVGQIRSMASRNGRITPANTPYGSPGKPYHPANCQVKSPFKHAVMKPILTVDGRVTPSQGLKERTTLAAHHLNKILTVANEKDAHKTSGKLQKGKLKPLYPVNVDGPSIDKCRGIISETRQYGASPSRTLQRRMHLINTIPNVHEYLYDRPRTVESVHRTSVASSIDDTLDAADYTDNLDSNRNVTPGHNEYQYRRHSRRRRLRLPDETLYQMPKSDSIMEPVTPENTFVPVQTHENTQEHIELSERTPRMFATEISANDPTSTARDKPLSGKLQHELYIGESPEARAETQLLQSDKNNSRSNSRTANQDREVTENDGCEKNEGDASRIVSSSKSVRFVEDKGENAKDIKQKTNASIAKMDRVKLESEDGLDGGGGQEEGGGEEEDTVSRKNKMNKTSCKADDIGEIYRKDDEGSDSEGKDNRGKDAPRPDTASQSQSAGSAQNKGDNSAEGKSEGKGDNSGKQAAGFSSERKKSKAASLTRPQSGGRRSRGSNVDKDKARSEERKVHSKGPCSRFERSKASKSHTPSLQVSSVIHGDAVATTLRPESPNRSPRRAVSPSRHTQTLHDFDPYTLHGNSYFSYYGNSTYDTSEPSDFYNHASHKSRVKFQLEGDTPEVDTIFIEEDDDVALRPDKDITFDTLDSELAVLRSDINNHMELHAECETPVPESESESEAGTDGNEEELEIDVEASPVAMDTIRGDYSSLLDKYRQRCMDRSESVGAISGALVTPRDPNAKPWHWRSTSQDNILSDNGSESKHSSKSRATSKTTFTDSGLGSVDNLSEMSKTVSTAISEVPRLELGSSNSDVGLGTTRSDVTDRSDETVTGRGEPAEEEEADCTKNLLEMVCESLAPVEKTERAESKKEMDEDVSKLKVVATTKSLSKSKNVRPAKASCPAAPFPPLCFTINARPPAGFLYYFAYGPDMNPNRFSSYVQRENQDRYWALLFGFNLVFNKKGCSEEAGGFANLEFNPLRSVEGCLYKITQQELQVLDKCVGYPEHFEHLVLPVWMSNSRDPGALGVAQYCVPALTYIAQNNWTETEKPLSCDYAISQCIKSADLVTPEYKDSLISMATQQQVTVSA